MASKSNGFYSSGHKSMMAKPIPELTDRQKFRAVLACLQWATENHVPIHEIKNVLEYLDLSLDHVLGKIIQ